MVVLVLICFAVGVVDTAMSMWMMSEVNERLPEGRKLAWWRRDNYWGRVNQAYREYFPDSILPDLENYFAFAVIVLIVLLVLVSFYKGRIG
jgi:hypothetical protein